MIRTVLVGWSATDWRAYRQPQWMAEVRRSPEATRLPRRHFDVEEDAFRLVLESWAGESAGLSESAAIDLLHRHGAIEITPP